jgi:GntR family transcriptional regulator, transcriptional repressor for pyruvate dehydrogenase complex
VRKTSLTSARSRVNPALERPRATRASAPRLFAPIKKRRVAEAIADRLRALIVNGTLPAGRPLPGERLLAVRFGVSRGSVRDAFRMLEMIGLLEMRHGQGTFPRELSVDRLVTPLASVLAHSRDLEGELMDVRRMFEPAVARAAAARMADDDLDALRRIVAAQRGKLRSGQSAILEDSAFHAALARATRNTVVVRVMETLNDLLLESRKRALQQRNRPERSLAGHEAVVAALARRDGEGAARAMHRHIDQIAALLRHTAPRRAAR